MTGEMMTSKSKKRLATKAQTIEDIWESVSHVRSAELNPPASRVVLTPRSAEACLRHGLNPEILRIRPLDSFSVDGLDPTMQRLRHETYTQRRFEMMRLVRTERRKLVHSEEREAESGHAASSSSGGGSAITPQQIIAQQAKQNASFLDEEEKRMGKMRKRQEKELEQMLQFEVKMQEIQGERDARLAQDRSKEEHAKRAKERRARAIAEEQRLREMKKAGSAEAEEQRRTAVSRATFEKDRCARLAQDRKDVLAKHEQRARDEERLRKAEEHKLHAQRVLSEQQAAIKRRMDDMELAEKERQHLVDRKRREERERLERRRDQMAQRIERNMHQALKVEELRKQNFYDKEAHHEALRTRNAEMQDRERSLQQRQGELQEQRRVMVLTQARRDEEKRKEDLLGRFDFEEDNVRRVRSARARDHAVVREKQRLRTQMKLENVERMRRIAEYKRLEHLRKIHEADRRTSEMVERKEELISTRKHNAVQIKMQKDALLEVMEHARSSGQQASKLIAQSVSSLKKPKKRAQQGGMADGTQRSQSANAILHAPDAGLALGPPPDQPMRTLQSNNTQRSHTQLPYVSPYDLPHQQPQTVTF